MKHKGWTVTVVRVLLLLAVFLAGNAVPAKAEVDVYHEVRHVYFSFPTFVDCANGGLGEQVDFSGTAVIMESFHVTSAGRAYRQFHMSLQGFTGVGQVTQDVYQGTGVSKEILRGTFYDDSQFVNTDLFQFNAIGLGSGVNYRFHGIFHFTRLDGDIYVSEVEVSNETCR